MRTSRVASTVFLFFCNVSILASAQSSTTTYSVISGAKGNDMGIVVDDYIYGMRPIFPGSALYRGEAPSGKPYRYVKLKSQTSDIVENEPFERQPPASGTPLNEFYGRNWTTKEVLDFPKLPFQQGFNRLESDLHLHDEIPTIHIQANPEDIKHIHTFYLQDIAVQANITYISSTKVETIPTSKLKVGGRSSRLFKKLGYNIKLPKGDHFEGYKSLKLRSTGSDPSYMREYLVSEMMKSASVPSSQFSFVRLIINDEEVGLFVMAEKYNKNWLKNEFGGGSKDYKNGILYQGHGGREYKVRASLDYKGDRAEDYDHKSYTIATKPKKGKNNYDDLVRFIQFIHRQLQEQRNMAPEEIDSTVTEWESTLDVSGFLAAMAFEFFHGSFDAYIQNSNNYYLYKDPKKDRFVYIPWDYDYTLGSGPVTMDAITVGDYNDFPGLYVRPLTTAILNVPLYRQIFEGQLNAIGKLYNPEVSFPIIDSIADFIRDDVKWDLSLKRVKRGVNLIPFGTRHSISDFVHRNASDDSGGLPITFSLVNVLDYLARVNLDVPFDDAVEGPTGHSSLFGIKEWFKVKYDNFLNKTPYKSGILNSPLHIL